MTTAKTVAAVDIGTNSVKLTVARRDIGGGLTILFDGTAITRLGEGVNRTGRIADDAAKRTLATLTGFGERARSLGAESIAAVGTSALRDATNGAGFILEAEKRLGGTVEIISGEREAQLTYRAARRDPEIGRAVGNADGLLFLTTDIGGGSTEVVQGVDDDVIYAESLQIGAVRLSERAGLLTDSITGDAFRTAVLLADVALADVPVPPAALAPVLIASGGTAANLAAMEITARSGSSGSGNAATFEAVHASRLSRGQIEARTAYLASLPLAERRAVPGLEPDRADVIVAGAIIQGRVMARLGVDSLIVSLRGLRYGLLYELLGA